MTPKAIHISNEILTSKANLLLVKDQPSRTFWENTKYIKWYKSHEKFYMLANLFIEDYENNIEIYIPAFQNFINSLQCHSKSEEKMFNHIESIKNIFNDHNHININELDSDEKKYIFCKSLIIHMKEEEEIIKNFLLSLKK